MDKILNKIKKLIPRKLFKALQPAYHFLLSSLAALVYRWPSEELIVIGVTGTTGKTTTVYLLAKMLTSAGFRVGYTSTAMFNDGEKEWLNDKKMTMVGRFFMQKILRQMVKNGCQFAIVETTSEGVVQFRHRFINYDTLVFTGIYSEHIDSHGSFENYKQAKGKLFAHLQKCKIKYENEKKKIVKSESGLKKLELKRVKKTIIVNGDDEHAEYFLNFWAEEKVAFTENENAAWSNVKTLLYRPIESDSPLASFTVAGSEVNLNLLGEFNIVNAMAALAVGWSLGLPIAKIKKGLEKVAGVPGRLENISVGQNFTVIIDYAFEPKAVAKLYEAISCLPHNQIIHVLGSAGGGRDVARRPRLGKLAGQNADYVIVTNEDPYDDDPEIIISQVVFGAEKEGKKINIDLFKILDREEAIAKAISLAKEGDMVLITGKGSEQAICVADGKKIPWDDREVVKKVLSSAVDK
jgi:UDP-N-acetylmuramoyl-L-alanyl-D-glutamate--2,6-diaminopimelate ligase